MKAADLKLKVELLPEFLHGFNLHGSIPKSRWAKLRKQLIADCGQRCEICGTHFDDTSKLEGHHAWEFHESSKPPVVRLAAIEVICGHCHRCEHWGNLERLILLGKFPEKARDEHIAHYCRVNGVTRKTFEKQHRKAILIKERRNKLRWRADWGAFADLILEYKSTLPQPIHMSF